MKNRFVIRLIKDNDAQAALDIYKPYVRDTVISFEYNIPSIEDFSHRIKSNFANFPWLVCEMDNQLIGYAYAGTHRYRTAYQWSTESTIYLSYQAQGKGIARILYETLFTILKLQGYINVYAGVVLPNENSVAFHRALGFEEIGIFKKVGYKLGHWYDTQWFQLFLTNHSKSPIMPKRMNEIITGSDLERILIDANERINKLQFSNF